MTTPDISLQWVDDLPRVGNYPAPNPEMVAIAKALIANSNQWAVIETAEPSKQPVLVNKGMKLRGYGGPGHTIKTATRTRDGACRLYARAVPR